MSLSNLSAKALHRLATHCGLSKNGTKAILTARLQSAALNYSPLPPSARILSIDLGLRNFAFSLLTVPPSSPLNPSSPKPSPNPKSTKKQPLVTLHAWRHINLLEQQQKENKNEKESPNTNDNDDDDPFAPPSMSHRAVSLILQHLLPLNPTHILIERQRFRSGGQAAVQEWTLRVNTLEAMLYASLATIKALNIKKWNGQLLAVPPSRVVKYLVGDEGVGERLLLERMLEAGGLELASEEVRAMATAFREAGQKKGRKGKKGEEDVSVAEEVGLDTGTWTKRDDLTDCLLQGIVWLEWHRNVDEMKRTVDWS
ncbi:mitochondrial resolvase Ydc2 [Cercophora newfieldiana]|uniref:Mitochondrial resolvase Ydc2 n=1 Tax=Cercophora newfieldiana TaxID=92897 RepID=A0AA39YFC8_9PEZI|nr:mitochondrial resolvase Ydc2 [Cercophora newfieldiana]